MSFQPDERIRSTVEASALSAVNFAKACFNIDLDWSENSIREVEVLLEYMHKDLPNAKLSEDKIADLAQLIGSYIGEVFRRHHGGVWGIVELAGEKSTGLKLQPSGLLCWPTGRARNRLVNGAEDNVWHYYQVTMAQARSADSQPEFLTDGPLPTEP